MANYTNKFILKADATDLNSKLKQLEASYTQTMDKLGASSKDVALAEKKLEQATKDVTAVIKLKETAIESGFSTSAEANKLYKEDLALAKTKETVSKRELAQLKKTNNAIKINTTTIKENIALKKTQLADISKQIALDQKSRLSTLKSTKALIAKRKAIKAEGVENEKLAKTKYNVARATRSANQANNLYTSGLSNTTNNLVRHIRRLESFLVALYAIKKGYDATLGRGHEFNKLIETETIGLKLLIAQNLKDVDSKGKQLNALQQFTVAQGEANKAIQIARDVNLETPQNFSQTIQIYKALTGQVLNLGGSLEETGKLTKRLSILASASGIDFQSFLKTVDTVLTGEGKQSQLTLALARFGITNDLIKEYAKSGRVLELFEEKLKNVDVAGIALAQTWEGSANKFLNVWDEMFAEIQKPIFDALKQDMADVALYLKENREEIVEFTKGIGEFSGYLLNAVEAFALYKLGAISFAKYTALSAVATRRATRFNRAYGTSVNALTLSVKKSAIAMKGLAVANAPLLLLVGTFEAWHYATEQEEKALESLNKMLDKTNVQIAKLTDTQLSLETDQLKESLFDAQVEIKKIDRLISDIKNNGAVGAVGVVFNDDSTALTMSEALTLNEKEQIALLEKKRGIQRDLVRNIREEQNDRKAISKDLFDAVDAQQRIQQNVDHISDSIATTQAQIANATDKERVALKEKLKAQQEALSAIKSQLKEANKLVESFDKSGKAVYDTADGAVQLTDGLSEAVRQSLKLEKALTGASSALAKTLNQHQVLLGNVSGSTVTAINDAHAIRVERQNLLTIEQSLVKLGNDRANATKTEDVKKLDASITDISAKHLQSQNRLQGAINTEIINQNKNTTEGISLAGEETAQAIRLARVKKTSAEEIAQTEVLVAQAELNTLIAKQEVTKEVKGSFEARKEELALGRAKLKVSDAEAEVIKAKTKDTKKGLIGERALEKLAKAKLTYAKEQNKQEVLIAKIKTGVNGLSDIELRNLQIKHTTKELELQKKIVKEAKEGATTDKLKAQAQKEVTTEYELQLRLIHLQATAWDDIFADLKNSLSDFSSAFAEGGMEGLQDSVKSFASGAVDTMKNSTNPYAMAIGYAIDIASGLLSNTLSEAEIKTATGESSFDSHSLTDIYSTLEKYQAPQLTATRSMLLHLESMDDKFGSIANALSSNAGFDFDGSEFQASADSSFWGDSSTELLGAGLSFGQQTVAGFIEGVEVAGYQAVKETSSSWFGLVTNEKINNIESEVPQRLKDDLGEALNESVQGVMDAVEVLGFDSTAIQEKLDNFVLDLGKINFNELDAEEKVQALKDAFSGQLNNAFEGAINAIASPENISALNSIAKTGEEYTATLVRASVQHEIASKQLALFGQTVDDFATSDSLVQAVGGIEKFQSAMATFTQNFFSGEEQREMQRLQLEMALQTQNVALPATKAQFRALVLETQQKIINVKATISALKAEIVAKQAGSKIGIESAISELVAKGKIAQSEAEVIKGRILTNNGLIRSENELGKASVAFGTNLHNAGQNILGAGKSAIQQGQEVASQGLDVDWDALTSPAIEQAEAELTNLEGLYGTLMSNMGTFADYYGGVESSASSASDKLNELEKSLLAIANLKAVWTGDDISAKKIILDATRRYTKLDELTYDNFLEKFEALTSNGLGLDQETLSAWSDMSSALRAYNDAQASALKADISFYENIIQTIESAYTGNLSYLNSSEKLDYLSQRTSQFKADGDDKNYIKSLQEQLALEKKQSVTREEYAVNFDKYINEVKSQQPEKTTDDVVDGLDVLADKLDKLEDAIERASYQRGA